MSIITRAITAILLFTCIHGISQDDKRTLFTYGDQQVPVSEFMYVYNKNNSNTQAIDKKSLEEYLELYINFRLKVREAELLGLDTVKAFIDELAGYRKQLAEPYFIDDKTNEKLLNEAYERKQTDLRASHILIKVGPNALPDDTLAAYNKIMDIRKRILAGESFSKLASELSDDPSARDRQNPNTQTTIPGNGGDIGYFTVFDMVYPFETCAYNTKVGEVSMPVRTDFGYHLLKVTDRQPAKGTMQIAHIYMQIKQGATHEDSLLVQSRIDSVYQKLQNGEDFNDLAQKYSDDKGSANRGGMLPEFTVNRMVPEIIQAITAIPDSGDVSAPILTPYGWHLLKLYKRTGVKPFDEIKNDLKSRVKKDVRSSLSKDIVVARIKKEYGFTSNLKALEWFYDKVDSAVYKGNWKAPENASAKETIFSIADKKYSQKDFAAYFEANQAGASNEKLIEFVNKVFKMFVSAKCIEYEDSRLEQKYPDFKALMREYRDGILLFELTDRKVWTQAMKDTTGLKEYHAKHASEYMWGERLEATIYSFDKPEFTDIARDLLKKGLSPDEIVKEINKDSLNIIKTESKKYSKNDHKLIDAIEWKKGVTENKEFNGRTVFVDVKGIIPPMQRNLSEARGLVTADYQTYLEHQWIKELRAKYPVKVNQEVLTSLTK